MRQYARIEGREVKEVIEHPDTFNIPPEYHPSLSWIEITGVTPAPRVGWLFDRGTGVFVATRPPSEPPDPGDEIVVALQSLKGSNATIDQLIDVLLGDAGRQGRIAGQPV